MSNVDIITKAFKNDSIEVKFQIPGTEIVVIFGLGEAQEIFAEQDIIKRDLQIEYEEKYGDKPLDENRWNKYIKEVKPEHKKRLEKEKPLTRAEQFADEDSAKEIITKILPRYLRDAKGNLLFPTEAEQIQFGNFIKKTPSLIKLFSEKMIELTGQVAKLKDETKK